MCSETYRISGVVVSVIASSAENHGFEPRLDQAKDYEIGICCFSRSIKEKVQRLVGSKSR